MKINVDSLFRSAVALAIGLPLTLAVLAAQAPEEKKLTEAEELKQDLMVPCLRYALTEPESKAERAAMDAVDEVFSDGVDYKAACNWVLG